ncbi:MAG: hypothetical protein QXR22_00215 [Acidilobaceae archaeon]
MVSRFLEYIGVLGFPLLVFTLSLIFYPVESLEASFASESALGEGFSRVFPSYINFLVPASNYGGWVTGYGRVIEYKGGLIYNQPSIILTVETNGKHVKVIIINPVGESSAIINLTGVNIMFHGPIINVKGDRVVLARVIVVGHPMIDHYMHHTMMCVHKEKEHEKCMEMMEKYREYMKRGRD